MTKCIHCRREDMSAPLALPVQACCRQRCNPKTSKCTRDSDDPSFVGGLRIDPKRCEHRETHLSKVWIVDLVIMDERVSEGRHSWPVVRELYCSLHDGPITFDAEGKPFDICKQCLHFSRPVLMAAS